MKENCINLTVDVLRTTAWVRSGYQTTSIDSVDFVSGLAWKAAIMEEVSDMLGKLAAGAEA